MISWDLLENEAKRYHIFHRKMGDENILKRKSTLKGCWSKLNLEANKKIWKINNKMKPFKLVYSHIIRYIEKSSLKELIKISRQRVWLDSLYPALANSHVVLGVSVAASLSPSVHWWVIGTLGMWELGRRKWVSKRESERETISHLIFIWSSVIWNALLKDRTQRPILQSKPRP